MSKLHTQTTTTNTTPSRIFYSEDLDIPVLDQKLFKYSIIEGRSWTEITVNTVMEREQRVNKK